jgi:glycosyltransferase involved in cell wall biosynthesis
MKIALVHDWLTDFGGAEQTLISLRHIWPEAPIYTLLYNKKKMERYFPQAEIRTSFLQKFPKIFQQRKEYLLPFLPTAPETFDLRDFDLVISSSNSFAKGIITKPKTIHISYCHAPMRFVWDWYYNYLKERKFGKIKKIFVLPILHYFRMWDKISADRVNYFIANSKTTAEKIRKYYSRESKVIYPPVNINEQTLPTGRQRTENNEQKTKKYFLIVSRLSPYKKIDLAIKAFNKLELPLIIIGDGKQKKDLQKMAKKNIKFLGFQPKEKIPQYYQNCRAFIFPGEDDFGITACEAMSYGKPILAYRKGGLTETMIELVTGEFFNEPAPELLADGVRRLMQNEKKYNSDEIKKQAEKFSKERFEKEIKEYIEQIFFAKTY